MSIFCSKSSGYLGMLDIDNVTATARKRGGDSSREPELMMVARVGPYHIINPPKKKKKTIIKMWPILCHNESKSFGVQRENDRRERWYVLML